ncbi:hypothetical protein [Streptomyces sp. ECR3]|uniref:hypothetical protein n=1 Tax=Streptomyces sp. ECR3 TaxID=3400630 RepID=UPI003F1B96C6
MGDTVSSPRTARLVTDTLAPANLVMAILLIIGWHSTSSLTGLGWGVLAALFCGGIPFTVILVGVRAGWWTDKHVKVRSQRPAVFLATALSVLVAIVLLVLCDAPREVFALVVAMLFGLLSVMLVNHWWKVSVHTAVASGVATILALSYGAQLLLLYAAVAVIGWSRVALRDHTMAQTIVGAAVGGLVAAVVFTLLR